MNTSNNTLSNDTRKTSISTADQNVTFYISVIRDKLHATCNYR